MTTRRIRAFKRWMKWQGIDCSDALDLQDQDQVCVKALCDLHEGDLVATIPKQSCLTVKTSHARHVIESAGLQGSLALSFAIMYEKSLGQQSPWFCYLQLMPHTESIPLLWSSHQIDSLLYGTELHKTVKEDKDLVYEDWRTCILPLLDSYNGELNPIFFGIEQYLSAKSLVASRSFEIDNYHGSGMVPLADLFNHKTDAEDVHFTAVSLHSESGSDTDGNNNDQDDSHDDGGPSLVQNFHSRNSSFSGSDFEGSSIMGDNPMVREMIVVKDVKAGAEVFNTYGSMGNAALLHRYGFTEPDNPYDIVNLDLELVRRWSSSLFSLRYSRKRLSLWRRLDYSGCVGQNSDYFEVSFDGVPEIELLILLYIMLLPDEAYNELDLRVSTEWNFEKSTSIVLSKRENVALERVSEKGKDLLLTKRVRSALLSLADIRESSYGLRSLEDDIEALKMCCPVRERKVYHSLMLRVSERRILEKLRTYASASDGLFRSSEKATMRKKSKRT